MRTRCGSLISVFLISAAGVALSACAGSSRTTTAPIVHTAVTDTLIAVAAQTGSITSGAGIVATAFASTDVIVGDEDANVNGTAVRGVIGFDLSGLPSAITVQTATLVANQCQVNGQPFVNLGNVVLEHVSYTSPLDTTAFAVAPLDSMADTLSADSTAGVRTAAVTSPVTSDLANHRTSSQYRLRMANADYNGDGVTDDVVFAADSAHTFDCPAVSGRQPRLIVVYKTLGQ